MSRPIRILLLEDNPADAELIERELKKGSFTYELRRLDAAAEFDAAVSNDAPHIIISDYSIPSFGAPAALKRLHERGQRIPLIVVSGTVSEPALVELLHLGADDYILKDHLGRIPWAVMSTLRRRELERDKSGLEEQLRQSQKIEAIGRLAGGVAHDFNNLLTAISGYSDLLLDSLSPGDPNRADVEEIKKAAARAGALTKQLMTFSRKQVLQPRVLALKTLLTGLSEILRQAVPEQIHLSVIADPKAGNIQADPSQIEQVIMNLVLNARDAIQGNGQITIETKNFTLEADEARLHLGAAPGPYVMLSVSDTGVGMDEEIQSHLFEPFFTTKEKGKGTGLGLSTLYGIVKHSQGFIALESSPGKGSTFRIYFPRVEEAAAAPKSNGGTHATGKGSETILLVEDESAVRDFAKRVLGKSGYRILDARHGADALAIFRKHADEIDLVLTDVVMPEMNGQELAEKVAALKPGIRTLFMSGYSDVPILQQKIFDKTSAFLQKPFAPEDLLSAVRRVLDEAPKDAA